MLQVIQYNLHLFHTASTINHVQLLFTVFSQTLMRCMQSRIQQRLQNRIRPCNNKRDWVRQIRIVPPSMNSKEIMQLQSSASSSGSFIFHRNSSLCLIRTRSKLSIREIKYYMKINTPDITLLIMSRADFAHGSHCDKIEHRRVQAWLYSQSFPWHFSYCSVE